MVDQLLQTNEPQLNLLDHQLPTLDQSLASLSLDPQALHPTTLSDYSDLLTTTTPSFINQNHLHSITFDHSQHLSTTMISPLVPPSLSNTSTLLIDFNSATPLPSNRHSHTQRGRTSAIKPTINTPLNLMDHSLSAFDFNSHHCHVCIQS